LTTDFDRVGIHGFSFRVHPILGPLNRNHLSLLCLAIIAVAGWIAHPLTARDCWRGHW
jgi:hypothetical protein